MALSLVELEHQLAGLASEQAGGCLITLMVPATCRDLNQYSALVSRELTTATNVKDKANRRSILSALRALRFELQQRGSKVPGNGLALFGLVTVHGEEAAYYRLIGTQHQLLDRASIHRLKQHKCGGQSAQRFGRIREGQLNAFIARVAERANELYLDNGSNPNIQTLIVLGVGEVKDKAVKLLHGSLLKRLSLVGSVPTTELSTVMPIVDAHLRQTTVNDQQHTELVERNLPSSWTGGDTIYGPRDLLDAAQHGTLKQLVVHTDVKATSWVGQAISRAEEHGCEVVEVNLRNEEGTQLLEQFGGVIGVPWFRSAEQ